MSRDAEVVRAGIWAEYTKMVTPKLTYFLYSSQGADTVVRVDNGARCDGDRAVA